MHYVKAISILSALLAAVPCAVSAAATRGEEGTRVLGRGESDADIPFEEWVAKGVKRWGDITKALQDTSGTDEAPTDFGSCDDKNNKWFIDGAQAEGQVPKNRYAGMIAAAKLPISATDANNYNIHLGYPWNGQKRDTPTADDEDKLRYDNYYNPKDNVIVAEDLWKGSKPKPGITLQSYSQPTFTMWNQVKKERDPNGKSSDLKALVHYSCSNPGAFTVAQSVCKDDKGNFLDTVRTLEPNSDDFNAVLGIDNGKTVVGILIGHKHALNFKSLADITLWCSGTEIMGVSYNFGPSAKS